jgi:hypothetical protein
MSNRRRTLREAFTIPAVAAVADSFDGENAAANDGGEFDRRGILVRVSPALRHRLKLTALNRGLTVQALMLEAIAEVLKKPDRPPEPCSRAAASPRPTREADNKWKSGRQEEQRPAENNEGPT